MAEFDLTSTIMKYLDRHMVLPVLEWLQEQKLYKETDLRKAKLDLVSKTSMIDFAAEEYRDLHNTEDVPEALEQQRAKVYDLLSETQAACGPFTSELTVELIQEIQDQNNFDMEYLSSKYNVTEANVTALYPFAKLIFDCGRYADAAEYLYNFRQLNTESDKNFWALWGKLSAEILMVNCVTAREDLKELRDLIDQRLFVDHFEQIQQRTWLLHWSLFVFFNLENGMQDLIEFCLQEKIMNTIQTTSPHILRYLSIATVVSSHRKSSVKELVRILVAERDQYRDPVTEFLMAIYTDFDFKAAYTHLQECEQLVTSDFFLAHLAGEQKIGQEFITNAKQMLFEAFCGLYSRIDLKEIARTLGFAENADYLPKIVSMIREARMDAKIDAENMQLIVTSTPQNVHQQIVNLDKDKNLSERTRKLMSQVEKKYSLLAQGEEL